MKKIIEIKELLKSLDKKTLQEIEIYIQELLDIDEQLDDFWF